MMDKLVKLVQRPAEKLGITADHFLHMFVSFMIAFVFGVVFSSSIWVLVGTMLIGVGKEIYDTKKEVPSGFDVNDLAFDSLGAVVGLLLSYLF